MTKNLESFICFAAAAAAARARERGLVGGEENNINRCM